jgi:hypothetical protein
VLRVGALDADGHVGVGENAVEIDQDRDQPLAALRVAEDPPEEARLPELPRGVEADVVAADRRPEELLRLGVAVDQILGGNRPRVDEWVRVGDYRMSVTYHLVC